jgi:hypothetical protein
MAIWQRLVIVYAAVKNCVPCGYRSFATRAEATDLKKVAVAVLFWHT